MDLLFDRRSNGSAVLNLPFSIAEDISQLPRVKSTRELPENCRQSVTSAACLRDSDTSCGSYPDIFQVLIVEIVERATLTRGQEGCIAIAASSGSKKDIQSVFLGFELKWRTTFSRAASGSSFRCESDILSRRAGSCELAKQLELRQTADAVRRSTTRIPAHTCTIRGLRSAQRDPVTCGQVSACTGNPEHDADHADPANPTKARPFVGSDLATLCIEHEAKQYALWARVHVRHFSCAGLGMIEVCELLR